MQTVLLPAGNVIWYNAMQITVDHESVGPESNRSLINLFPTLHFFLLHFQVLCPHVGSEVLKGVQQGYDV